MELSEKSAHRNVTLSLPEPLLREFRVYAAKRDQSMTALMAEAIRGLIDQDDERKAAETSFLERIKNPPGRSAEGRITWTRDEVNERRP